MVIFSRPENRFEPRPFASQTKVSFEAPSTVVYDKKFDTAIRSSHLSQHYERMQKRNETLDDILTSKLENYPPERVSDDLACAAHAKIMLGLLNSSTVTDMPKLNNPAVPNRTYRMVNLAFDNIEFQCGYLHQKNSLPSSSNSFKELKHLRRKETEDLTYLNVLVDYADWLLGVINMSNAMYADYYKTLDPEEYVEDLSKRNVITYKPLGLTLSWSHNFCVIKYSGETVLLPRAYILMLHNKVSDLVSILIYAKAARYSSMPMSFPEKVIDVCVELWNTVAEMGQDGFAVAKCMEAFASAESLVKIEDWDNSEFLDVITRDLYLDVGYSYKTSNLRAIWRKESSATIHELACLSKIAGHPLVDMEGGVQAIHKYTTEQYELNYDKINECTCYVKQNYIRNYILRYGRWPAHQITSSAAPDALKYGSLLNQDPEGHAMRTKYGEILVQHYNFVELEQEQRFNKLENIIPHLKDKTISALRGHVVKKYIDKQDIKVTWSDTRLLLYYLLHTGNETDHTEFLKEYGNGASLEEFIDYLVIRIVPKEKELKIKFRGFGCTTFANRMLFLAQEKTAMSYLDLYCDEQAMTLSELDLVKRLFAFRCLTDAYPRHEVLYVMVDASKWNNHFRRETTDMVMSKTLDKIYGTRVFGRTHEKYKNTLFYVPDGDYTYFWEGQDGGIEGLNQDTWVIVYISQIKTALSGMDLKYHILCKGDDLRLAVLIPVNDDRAADMAETKNIIMKRLADTAKDMGHDIKVYDSYGSTRYFNFSKSASIDKTELSQVLRKIQKCYGATNAFLPTIDDYVGSTFSNAHSACRVTTNVIPCFFVALVWAYYYLLSDTPSAVDKKQKKRRPVYTAEEEYDLEVKNYSELSDKQLIALMLVPSACGGFPIIHLHNMIVRAESDLVPAFLDLIEYSRLTNQSEMFTALKNFLYFDSRRKTTWRPIYMDMYAMPISKPATASFVLRSSMMKPLQSITTCPELTELFELIEEDSGSQKIVACLDSCVNVPAKVFSVIFSCLPESILSEIVRKFETARSVMELLIMRKGKKYTVRVLRKVLSADIQVNKWRLARIQGAHSSFSTNGYRLYMTCPAQFAYELRRVYWGKPIDGITMPPMAHLLGFCTIAQAGGNNHIRTNHFTLYIEHPSSFIPGSENNYHFGRGSKRPFLGHRTGTGTVNPVLHLVEKDKFLSNLRNLAELASWVQTSETNDEGVVVHSNLYYLIGKIIKLYTSEDLTTFAPFLGGRRSGTVAHHIRTRHFRESIVPNSLSNIYQYVEGESNTHRKFFGDHGHYWINFLQILCHGIAISTWELNVLPYFTTPSTVWIYTEDCDFCLRQVEEKPIVVDLEKADKVRFPQLQLIKLGSDAMAVLQESLSIAKSRKYNIEGNALELTQEQATIGTLKMILEMSVEASMRLTDRFTQHPGSRAGASVLKAFAPRTKRRVIGQRELSSLDNEVLCKIIPFVIVQLMMKYLNRRALVNIPDSLHTIPPVHLPWYELIHELSRVGRLHHLSVGISELAEKYPYYLTYKPEQVTAYLGVISLEAIGYIRDVPDLILLSDYEVTDIHRHLKDHLFVLSWATYIDNLLTLNPNESKVECTLNAILRDYIIDNVIPDVDGDEQLEVSGTYRIERFYEQDDIQEVLEILANSETDEDKMRVLNYRHVLFTKHSRLRFAEIFAQYDLDPYLWHGHMGDWMEQTQITVLCTTAWACLTTLREATRTFRETSNLPDDYHVTLDNLSNTWRTSLDNNRYGCIIPRPSENPAVSTAIITQPLIRDQEYFPLSSHLWRPYGVHNASTNHLMLIFHYLNVDRHIDFTGLSLCSMGDGLGNCTQFLARFGHRMRIVFTSKPDNQMLHISPSIALETITQRRHLLYNSHIRDGIWDLKDAQTFRELHVLYQRHDIYLCDAEPTPGEADFFQVYYNVCNYYVETRKEGGVLIMQIRSTSPMVLGKCLSFLGMHCTSVNLFQPPSITDPDTYYVVASGTRHGTQLLNAREVNITPRTAAIIRAFFIQTARQRNDERTRGLNVVNLRSDMPRLHWYRLTLPPLWISMMSKELGVAISETEVLQYVTQSSGNRSPWTLPIVWRLNTLSNMNYLREGLDAQTVASRAVLARGTFSTDFHANRLIRVYRLMVHYGFNWALSLYHQGYEEVTEDDLKGSYLAAYLALPARDRILDIESVQFFSVVYEMHTGLKVSYWSNFVKGVRILQEFSAWLHCIQQMQRGG
nr:MAG: RNA-dependent RNA polymerase [Hattula chuvirus]